MWFADFKGPIKFIVSERHGSDTLQGSINRPDLPYVSGFALFFQKTHFSARKKLLWGHKLYRLYNVQP